VAEALRQAEPAAHVLFLCTQRDIDRRILQPGGFDFQTQPVRPLPKPWRPAEVLDFYRRWRASLRQCETLLHQFDGGRRVVLGLGGFASGPAVKVAARLAVPRALLNPDAVPGKANRFARRYAQRIFLQWPVSRRHFLRDGQKCLVTGCPIRHVFATPSPTDRDRLTRQARQALGLSPDRPLLAVVGGSQGGHTLNEAVLHCLTARQVLPSDWQLLHQTGLADQPRVAQTYAAAHLPAVVLPFTDRMDLVLQAADLVLGRAGASSLAELTALGVGSILVPYPYHRDRHQEHNARVLCEAGAAKIVADTGNAAQTAQALTAVLADCVKGECCRAMGQAAQRLARPQAAADVAGELVRLARENGG